MTNKPINPTAQPNGDALVGTFTSTSSEIGPRTSSPVYGISPLCSSVSSEVSPAHSLANSITSANRTDAPPLLRLSSAASMKA